MTTIEPHDGLWFSTACRCCGDLLQQINAGTNDGVTSRWVGKCTTCRREFAVVAEMVALRNPSRDDLRGRK